jgi:cell division protein FtsQ
MPALIPNRQAPTPRKPRRGTARERILMAWRRSGVRRVILAAGLLGLVAAGGVVAVRFGVMAEAQSALDRGIERVSRFAGLTVETILVSGRVESDHEDIARALGVRRGDLMVGFDPELARLRLENNGWIRTAHVRRIFPRTIAVSVVERQPFAIWQHRGAMTLVDRDGAVIGRDALDRFSGLPVIAGTEAPGKVGSLVRALAREPSLFTRFEAATLVAGRRWDVRLGNGVEVMLPSVGMAEAWTRLAEMQRDYRLLDRDIVVVDLRLADRTTVRLGVASAPLRREGGHDA